MLRITCPYCGVRDHEEFTYVGDATKVRPDLDASSEDWYKFVYLRDNPRGAHQELWQHNLGCRSIVKVLRDTASHEILDTGYPGDKMTAPAGGGDD